MAHLTSSMSDMAISDVSNWTKLQVLMNHACATLQELFLNAWKTKTGNEWDKTCSEMILTLKLKNLGKDQQAIIKEGDVKDWDLSTLRALLCAEELFTLSSVQRNGIAGIVDIRNKINHLPNNTIPQQQFEEWWKRLQEILIDFGFSETDLEQLKQESRVSGIEITQEESINPKNVTKAVKLKDQGNAEFKKGCYTRAIELYSKGITLPGLTIVDRTILLSNRCISYLKMYKAEQDASYLNNGKFDAEETIRLRPDWWKGYCRMGQVCMDLKNYKDAVRYLHTAAVKEPQNREVADLLSNARRLLGEYKRMDFLDRGSLHDLPIADVIYDCDRQKGVKTSPDEIKRVEDWYHKSSAADPENHAYCRQGDKYRYGRGGVAINYPLAVKYYKMAADCGSAMGMYNLGQLSYLGEGAKQDFAEGIEWFKKAASQRPYMEGKGTCVRRNVGVAEAQHTLGLCYSDGTGVEKNVGVAINWYYQASINGFPNSSNKLGLMYLEGIFDGKPNLIKAEQYFRISAIQTMLPDCEAMLNLARLYYKKFEFEKVLNWCYRAEYNISSPFWSELKFMTLKVFEDFPQSKVPAWESENSKSIEGWTVAERIKRFFAHADEASKAYERYMTLDSKLKSPSSLFVTTKNRFDPDQLQKCAEHSDYGRSLWVAKQHYLAVLGIMEKIKMTGNNGTSLGWCVRLVEELVAGAKIDTFLTAAFPPSSHLKIFSVINLLMKRRLSFDEDIRVCYVGFQSLQCPEHGIRLLDECIQLYPQNIFFLKTRANLNAFLKRYEDGLKDIRSALKLVPQDADILFGQAGMMRLAETFNSDDVIAIYKQFLQSAPNDHRHVPEAFYEIAILTLDNLKEHGIMSPEQANEYLCEAKNYYDQGLVSEAQQLSVFLPHESTAKALIEYLYPKAAEKWHSHLTLTPHHDPTAETEDTIMHHKLTDPYRIYNVRHQRNYAASSSEYFKKLQESTHMSACSNAQKEELWEKLANFAAREKHLFTRSNKPPTKYSCGSFEQKVIPHRKQQVPQSLADLKPISLWDMDPINETVYEGCVLAATVLNDLVFVGSSICFLIEDQNGCVERCFIHNSPYIDDIAEARRVFGPGCRMSFMNPYRRICAFDQEPAIRVDDPGSVVFDGFVPDMCHYCCSPNAPRRCAQCKKALYCDKSCQKKDWKIMEHKLVCKTLTDPVHSEAVVTLYEPKLS